MAPEVLDGTTGMNVEAFLVVDVYALGLILWELLSRCSVSSGDALLINYVFI